MTALGPIRAVAVKDLRLLTRDGSSLFFTFVFPMMVALFFGFVFGSRGGGGGGRIDIALVNEDGGPASLAFANDIIETLPRGRSHLADQFTRAATSIVLNLAEGAGKHSKPDKRRYYLTARGSATESAALLDVCLRLTLLDERGHKTGKDMLVRVVSMVIKLAQSCEE